MNVHSIRHAGIPGIANRGLQEISKSLDRLASRVQSGVPLLVPPEAAAHANAAGGGRFFRGPAEADVALVFADRFGADRDRILFAAEARRDCRFDLLGHRALSFGKPVDWHLDPVSGRRAPEVHWTRIDALDHDMVGDHKVVWELNRHQWFAELGQAWRLTGDERYAEALVAFITGWMRDNRPGIGINWASSLEVAIRLMSWSWALSLLRGSKALTAGLYAEALAWIRTHARHVERYLSYLFSPNTHLTGEALGLFHAGVVFPELDGAGRWRRLGKRILLEELDRQVLHDGVHFEQSTCYHRYTVEIYLQLLILAARNGIALPAEVGDRVQAMVDYLLVAAHPDGTVPRIGDDDGGTLLRLVPRASDDARGVFATAAALFKRSDYAWAAHALQPEVLWLLGVDGCAAFDGIEPAPPKQPASTLFPAAGHAVMRNDWSAGSHRLDVDAGPLCAPVSGHGHADLLAVQCSVAGEPIIVDPGTATYSERAWRDHFRGTGAHSTVTIDGHGQAEAAGPFGWVQRPAARVRRWMSNDDFDLVDAAHDAYGRLADPVRHRRRALFVKPHYWVLIDDLAGDATHRVDLHFQFAPWVTLEPGVPWLCAHGRHGERLYLRRLAPTGCDEVVRRGSTRPRDGWVSAEYGRREAATALTWSTSAVLPLRAVTLLYPAAPGEGPPPEVVWCAAGNALCIATPRETVTVTDERVTVEYA